MTLRELNEMHKRVANSSQIPFKYSYKFPYMSHVMYCTTFLHAHDAVRTQRDAQTSRQQLSDSFQILL